MRLVLAVVVLLPAVASAQKEAAQDGTPIVTITRVSGAGSDRAAGFVAHYVRESFATDDRYQLETLSNALGDATGGAAQTALENALQLAERGRQSYDILELDQAVESLNAAVREYDRHVAYVTDFRKVSQTLMLLGATHILR
ncbi:MAG: hypothetical protein AAFY60_06360, partial [Myxococcota bacterium]